jgi:hypothetical protein
MFAWNELWGVHQEAAVEAAERSMVVGQSANKSL